MLRVFETYAELQRAYALPADAPGAYRGLQSFGPAAVRCDDCGKVEILPHSVKPHDAAGSTGYAVTRPDNRMLCYACADARQRAELQDRSRPFTGYISGDGRFLTTWTGGILGHVVAHSSHVNNWNARVHCYTVRDVHGKTWHGRNSGRGMCITIRPSKGG